MKTFKKALSIVLGLAMMLSCVAGMHVSAEGTSSFTVTVGKAEAIPGETVELPITITDVVGGYTALGFAISYDSNVLTLAEKVDVTGDYDGTGDSTTSTFYFEQSENLTDVPYNLIWAYVDDEPVTTAPTEAIATLKFTVKEDAALGDTTVAIAANAKSGSMNGNADVDVTYVAGTVTVASACEHTNTSWNVTTAPTYTTTGLRDLICDDCGVTLETDAVAPRVLRIASAALVLENNISIVWKIDATYFTTGGYTNPCLIFTFNGESEEVYDYEVNGSQYWFYFRKAKPQDMLDTVNATIKATYNGEEIIGSDSKASIDYSIYQYCSSQLSKTATKDNLRRLIVDLLNYGAAKQVYVGKNVDNLPNADISDDQLAFGTQSIRTDLENKANPSYISNENTTTEFKGATLVLLDSVEVQAQFASKGTAFTGAAGELDGYSIVVAAYDDKEKVEQSWTLTPEDTAFNFNSTNKRYLVNFSGLRARQFSTEAYFTVYKDGVAISDTLRYTIESYAARNYSTTTNANLKSLLGAMMNYGDSAYYYVLGKEVNAK